MIKIENKIINSDVRKKAIARFREKGIILPTFAQMRNPELIPDKVKNKLKNIGLWELNPLNLFRINWHNEPKEKGGLYGGVNYIEIPKAISGVDARIILIIGKWFPTGAHKVGAAYGCLAPRIISGEFDPTYNKAVWPSTGNYCRGGAFDSEIMGCDAVAILPEEMSKERFSWLKEIGAEVIATHGCESNVKEIYDACWDIRKNRKDCIIFNQFDEFGNPTWHYNVTGYALEEVYNKLKNPKNNFAGYISATGSAGTIAAGDFLRTKHPQIKVVASEALQCPTLLMNGFGGHRIEGIGDKHIPWIHNVKNTDAVAAIDDEQTLRILRLFNDPEGHKWLTKLGVNKADLNKLSYLGISSICNLLSAIKLSKYFEYNEDDVVFTVFTDSVDLYNSRLEELNNQWGAYSERQAEVDWTSTLKNQGVDYFKELSYYEKKAVHNLKYFTWVEQQGKSVDELNAQWYDENYWKERFSIAPKWDEMIKDFNQKVGLEV